MGSEVGVSEAGLPVIAVAIEEPLLRERVRRILGDEAQITTPAWPGPADADTSLIVLARDQVLDAAGRDALRAFTDHDGAPAVLVLSDRTEARDRTRLMANGASAVRSVHAPQQELAKSILALARSRAEGGHGGPGHAVGGATPRLADFVTHGPRMKAFLELVHRVAASNASLLITGETGVGKEHLARAIHAASPRAGGPFVTVNCGALPENLLESELFGHEAGAFTGATDRRAGRFEAADGGTIFLDEIGEMPTHVQVKLLTVLQRHEVQRLGAEVPVEVDVRVMAATNRDLIADVEAGQFREDLYYRLNVVPLVVPPLRERREAIPDLVGALLCHLRRKLHRSDVIGIADDALHALQRHRWPGNVRELGNVVERAMLLATGGLVTLTELPEAIAKVAPAEGGSPPTVAGAPLHESWLDHPLRDMRKEVLARFERAYLANMLRRKQGRVGEAAAAAGLSPRALYDKMKSYGLKKEDFKKRR